MIYEISLFVFLTAWIANPCHENMLIRSNLLFDIGGVTPNLSAQGAG